MASPGITLADYEVLETDTSGEWTAHLVTGEGFERSGVDLLLRETWRDGRACALVSLLRADSEFMLAQLTLFPSAVRAASWTPTYWEFDRRARTVWIGVLTAEALEQ